MKTLWHGMACLLLLVGSSAIAQEPKPVIGVGDGQPVVIPDPRALISQLARDGQPIPAVVFRLDNPADELRSVLRLFEGARAANPAAALAAWKRASREPGRLGKPLEALIASFNPRMVKELQTLHGAELSVWTDLGSGRLVWGARLPNDDGTFAALASALVLSGGSVEPPLEGLAVDRLGGPGAPIMAGSPRGLLVGSDRAGLEGAWRRSRKADPDPIAGVGRIQVIAEPNALWSLGESASLGLRRMNAILPVRLGPQLHGFAGIQGSSVLAGLGLDLDQAVQAVIQASSVDPAWLDWVPKDRAAAAFAIGISPRPEHWETTFAIIDRLEKLDPTRAQVAPARLRLALLGRTIGIRTEADILPHLNGVAGWFGSNGQSINRALIAFHLDNDAVAEAVVNRVKREAEGVIGKFEGQPLRLTRVDRSLVMSWGNGALEASIEARDHPDRSAGPGLRMLRGDQGRLPFVGGIWPGRVPGLIPEDSPLARSLADAPPVVWHGESTGGFLELKASWAELDATVKQFLTLIPLDPPPDH